MSTNTDWDVDYYKTDYESEEHWTLRRSFMMAHKDKFGEDELVCLAQVFTNVEFMGCRYPEETMRRVGMLSQEVAAEFRKSRAKKLKRTFVGAQDAAGAKAKGRSGAGGGGGVAVAHKSSNVDGHTRGGTQFVGFSQGDQMPGTITLDSANKPISQSASRQHPYIKLTPNKYKNLVLFDNLPNQSNIQILQISASKNGNQLTCKAVQQAGSFVCTITIDGTIIGQATHEVHAESKLLAADIALATLQKECYTIKKSGCAPKINVEGPIRDGGESSKTPIAKAMQDNFEENKLTNANKGFKMMKMMGWTGGALGSNQEGREEPVAAVLKVGRKGLGLDDAVTDVNINHKFFRNYLKTYASDDTNIHELVFAADYSKEERALLHKIAATLRLKSGSRNTPEGDRYLTISKKLPPAVMAEDILNGGIYSQQFELIAPTKAK